MTAATHLDRLLAAWAHEQRLDPAETAAMRDAILAEPRELSAAW